MCRHKRHVVATSYCNKNNLFILHIIETTGQIVNNLVHLCRCFLVQVETVVILRSVDCPQQTHHLVQVFVEKYAKHIEHLSNLCFAYQTYEYMVHVFVRFYFVNTFQIQTKTLQMLQLQWS